MNRQDLIDAIAQHTDASKVATARFVDGLIEIVQQEVAAGRVVRIAGFGAFEKVAVAERVGRNPKTGDVVGIPATHRPKFTPGAAFKGMVKGGGQR